MKNCHIRFVYGYFIKAEACLKTVQIFGDGAAKLTRAEREMSPRFKELTEAENPYTWSDAAVVPRSCFKFWTKSEGQVMMLSDERNAITLAGLQIVPRLNFPLILLVVVKNSW